MSPLRGTCLAARCAAHSQSLSVAHTSTVPLQVIAAIYCEDTFVQVKKLPTVETVSSGTYCVLELTPFQLNQNFLPTNARELRSMKSEP